jgi:hypothetical protein
VLYQYQIAVSADGSELCCYDSSNNLVTQIILNENGIKITGLPTTLPTTPNTIWNDSGTLKIS